MGSPDWRGKLALLGPLTRSSSKRARARTSGSARIGASNAVLITADQGRSRNLRTRCRSMEASKTSIDPIGARVEVPPAVRQPHPRSSLSLGVVPLFPSVAASNLPPLPPAPPPEASGPEASLGEVALSLRGASLVELSDPADESADRSAVASRASRAAPSIGDPSGPTGVDPSSADPSCEDASGPTESTVPA